MIQQYNSYYSLNFCLTKCLETRFAGMNENKILPVHINKLSNATNTLVFILCFDVCLLYNVIHLCVIQ